MAAMKFRCYCECGKGDLEIIRRRMIVEDGQVEDPLAQIAYSDATKIEPDFEVGEELYQRSICMIWPSCDSCG